MNISRIVCPLIITSLWVSAVSCRSTSESTNGGSSAVTNSPDSTAEVTPANTDSATTNALPTQTYAGETKLNTEQQTDSVGISIPIQVTQTRFDDSCTSLYAYDPSDTYVNVRDSPNGEILTSVDNFTTLQPADGSTSIIANGWNKIYIGHRTVGYVHGDLIRTKLYRVYDPSDTSANLRATPNGEVVTAMQNGSIVKFAGIEGDWTRVVTRGDSVGYVSTALLDALPC